MDSILQDLRHGARMLMRSPAFTLVAVVTLALGVGANTAIFSVVDAVLLRPLPYPEADRLVLVWSTFVGQGVPISGSALPDYREWRDHVHSFEGLAGFFYGDTNLAGEGQEPERVQAARVTPNLLEILGVRPAIGRSFHPDEAQFGRHHVALLSFGLFERRYGGDPGIVGRTSSLGGVGHTVIGILPEGVPFMDDVPQVEVLRPISYAPDDVMDSRNNHFVTLVGRLARGSTVEQAQAEISGVAARLEQSYPENKGMGATVVPLAETLVEGSRRGLLVLLGAVVFVLLVACANVANLLLARAAAREREVAIRASLGAGRARLVVQMLVEGLPLGVLAGALGFALAVWGVELLIPLLPAALPRYNPIGVDARVFAFSAAISLGTVVFFGLAPAWQASRLETREALADGGRSTMVGRRRSRLLGILVSVEMALALVLLAGAGLMLSSFSRLKTVDAGFAPEALTMSVSLGAKYDSPEQGLAFFEPLIDRLVTIPGVKSAGVTTVLPLGFGVGWGKYLSIEGRPIPASVAEVPLVSFALASADYLPAAGIPLRSGRGFALTDSQGSQQVAIVNEALVRRFFRDEEPVGKTLYMGAPESLLPVDNPETGNRNVRRTIVGVVADVKDSGLGAAVNPIVFVPYTQSRGEGWSNTMALAVRASTDPKTLIPSVLGEIRRLDSDQPVTRVATLGELADRSLSRSRFLTLLLGIFAAVAVLLAAVGIYGVSSTSVAQRVHEFGIRIALGARPSDVTGLVLGQGLKQVALGVAGGIVAALVLTRILAGELFDVSPRDPGILLGVAVVLVAVALVASYVPARRATRVDPAVTLRGE